MKKIGIVGIGIMGNGIANNYLKKGYKVFIWNRTKDKLSSLADQGAIILDTPKEVAKTCDILFEITANDESSRSVWLGEDGILAGAGSETILISSATVSAFWTDELTKKCLDNNQIFFDMPVTGGRKGAENGQLVLLVGGDENIFNDFKSDLAAISEKQHYFGSAGSGCRYKLLLNMLQAIHVTGLGEVLKIAVQSGMDIKKVGDALAERPGGVTTVNAWRDYQVTPKSANFSIQLMYKDLNYAKQFGQSLNLPLLDDVLVKFKQAIDNGLSDKDWTAVNKLMCK